MESIIILLFKTLLKNNAIKRADLGTNVSFHADSIIKRILKAVTFHAKTTGDHCSNPDEFKLDVEQEEVQSQLFLFLFPFSFPCYSFGEHILKPKRDHCSVFQYVWKNIYCFDFIFIAHNTGILGHKVTLQSHIRCTYLKNTFSLAVLHFKRWIGTCGCLNLVWFGL